MPKSKEEKEERCRITRIKRAFAKMERVRLNATHDLRIEIGGDLIAAKKKIKDDDWPQWLRENFAMSPSMAQECIDTEIERLAEIAARNAKWKAQEEERERERQRRAAMTEEEEIAEEVRRRRKEREEAEAFRQRMQAQFEAEQQARRDHQAEEEWVDKMTAKIVDTGYKTLATKLHPDKGGSHDDMRQLNAARTRLKRNI